MGNKNPRTNYVMKLGDNFQNIAECTDEKDLGVTFDENLTFDKHINQIVSKANQMTGMIKRTFMEPDKETFITLFKTFVRPHLEYGNTVWCPYLKRQSILIEQVQRRATKLIKGCKDMSYAERLKFLKLHSLKGRRLRGDLIQLYKIFHGLDDIDINI